MNVPIPKTVENLVDHVMKRTTETIALTAENIAEKMESGELQHPDGATALRAFAKALRQ